MFSSQLSSSSLRLTDMWTACCGALATQNHSCCIYMLAGMPPVRTAMCFKAVKSKRPRSPNESKHPTAAAQLTYHRMA